MASLLVVQCNRLVSGVQYPGISSIAAYVSDEDRHRGKLLLNNFIVLQYVPRAEHGKILDTLNGGGQKAETLQAILLKQTFEQRFGTGKQVKTIQ